ncbi:TrbI/VirB10 family protein [Granulibacter bethesdensis]|uniref:TrbI/VirB10 family protein n=1 Tax=Granulibacter bethesdensis TaxID=364410 RepID=UPI0003F21336|nr:TrbI/VirB10 family protein [Granulibacter bethesdensis]AHJ66171.1 Conjugal transfer protein trbI [Granulibacter bethesdensis CGDNIH4]
MAEEKKTYGSPVGQPPDFLVPPRQSRNVRRLNHLPLIIVGVFCLLAIFSVAYTLYQREKAMNYVAKAPIESGTVVAKATPPVHPSDAVPPTPPSQLQPIVPKIAPIQTQTMSEEYKARLELIQHITSRRVDTELEALSAASDVQGFTKTATQKAVNESTPMPRPLVGLPNADAMLATQAGNMGSQTDGFMPIVPPINYSGGISGSGIGGFGGLANNLGGFGILPGLGSGQNNDQNQQREKNAFLSQKSDVNSPYLPYTRTAPLSNTEVKAGTVIPGVMISGVDSDLPGQIIAQVRQNVYDTATGRYLLIPAGARLIGSYDSRITMGQSRVLVGWKRIIYPDGSSVSLDFMPGTDQSGYAGFKDQVNNHMWKIFGNALLMSVFSAGVQLSQPQATNGQNFNSSQIVAGMLGQQLAEAGIVMANRGMNIQPTLEIRPGYEFNIMVTKDVILPPWNSN